ncbi:nitrite reductase large subunit NirB [Actinospica sp.]|uniref:nitrite reductase large subunit NirB n=1 Tax=Actinospica sp. TaxID=1872142 RepID=UPI002C160CF6|nr:nitrite reductase large subunit NirB [Actinospica sp.]HWG25125.1 nitrite reductase large subunit NirB [Actinospica sp.]
MRILIVGYGMVGHRCASALSEFAAQRAADEPPVDIAVLSKEARPAYDRVHLTSLFNGSTDADLTYDDPPGVEVVLGEEAVALDREARIVTGSSGTTYAYDVLVLATGSRPFVPPVPGHDLPGCFVYRTVEDVDAIKEYAQGRRVGAVVGGGLLGLEAAGALSSLGLDTHVIEFAPRLMPLQVDDAGGMALRQRITDLGVTIHAGTRTEAVHAGGDGAAAEMLLAAGHDPSDQRTLPVEMVVFAAGVRPWDTLGREFGLELGERGGIRVDAHCLTSDPHVYAIGECAQAMDGRVYGLVAPGYSMAETTARHILGQDSTPFRGADLSTKLKLMGVDVASFGDAFGTTPGALSTLYSDESQGLYKKLVVTEDGRLLGGILVGDASAYDLLKPLAGTDTALPGDPIQLLLPAADGAAGATLGVGSLPDSATICSCHNVSKGTLLEAVRSEGCATVGALKSCTKAGTGCGSCVPMLGKILDSAGVEQSTALCPHFPQTRAELYEIVLVRGIDSYARLIAEHGAEGAHPEGCEICKPAVASILASLAGRLGGPKHILSGEQAALQDTNDHFLANLQKNGTYSVVPRIPGGEITPEKLIVIGEVARDFGLYTKITGGQRIDLFGARVEQLPAIWRRLVDAGFESGHAYGKALRTVKSCVGSTWCRYGVQDAVSLAIELELRYRGLRSPHKIKAAVSGCARECAEAQGKDIGVIATEHGWNLYVSGNGGFSPRHADLFAKDLGKEELIRAIDRFLMFYIRTAERLERTSVWMERIEGGLEHVREVVLEDKLGLGEELDALMAGHVSAYADEWRAAIEDPETLRRFVSFVNAPETPDPSIEFTTEREQIKPLLRIGRRTDRTGEEAKDLVNAG